MRKRRIVCLLLSLIVMMAMSTTTADAASFKSKPTGVKAKCVSGVSVQVSCKAKKGAKGYKFYYATKKNGKYKLGATSKSRTGTIKNLTPGKTYYFKVKAYKGLIKKKYTKMSKPVKCKTVFKAPGLSASAQCCCKIGLTMSKEPGATGFIIYRSTDSSSGFVQVGKTTATTWQDTGLSGSTTYYYKIKMYRGSYYSPLSAAAAATTLRSLGYGNGEEYSLENNAQSSLSAADKAKLKGRNIFFLGSSITYGSASGGVAFPDYIAKRNDFELFKCIDGNGENRKSPKVGDGIVWKEAVSGTTMARVTGNTDTYSFRLWHYVDTQIYPDVFVCQLSLNDANRGIELGKPKGIDFEKLEDSSEVATYLNYLYNRSFTVAGSIEYITAFAYAKWPGCQVAFYTISSFQGGASKRYADMIDILYEEATKNNIEILDLWNNPEISAWETMEANQFCLYMADAHHPKRAGYLQWTPLFESALVGWMPDAYTVTWKNGEDVLEKDLTVRYKQAPVYNGELPKKAEDEDYTYDFVGWRDATSTDPDAYYTPAELESLTVEGNMTFIAVFEAKEKQNEPPESGEPENVNGPDTNNDSDPPEDNDEGGNGNDSDGNPENNVPDGITGMMQSLLRAA